MLAYPNLADVNPLYSPAPVLTGGSWLANLPLTNLQDRRIAKVARSTNDDAASTQFDLDLGSARTVRVVALIGVNFSSAATVEIEGGTSQGATDVYNGTAVAGYPAGETAESLDGLTLSYLLVLPSNLSARWWRVKIVDTSNPDNYVQIGRLFVAPVWQPTYNADYGLVQGWEDDSRSEYSEGGATLHVERRKRRTLTFTLSEIAEAEAMANHFPIQHRQGTTRQMYVIFDPADTTMLFKRSFLCVQQDISSLAMRSLSRYGAPMSLVEEL